MGTGPLGTGPWGTGVVGIISAQALSTVTVRATFNSPVQANDPTDPTDALYALNWAFPPLDPGVPSRLAQTVTLVDVLGMVFDITADGALGSNANYTVVASGDINPLAGNQCACFVSAQVPPEVSALQVRDRFQDIANPNQPGDGGTPLDAPLGTYQITSDGDYALDGGTANLKKRIMRRLTTSKGGFFHLPEYGDLPILQGSVKPGALIELQAKARAGVLKEPDVLEAKVTVRREPAVPDVVFLDVQVRNTQGVIERVTLPVRIEQ